MSSDNPKVIVALDYADAKSADAFVDQVDPKSCKLKVGKELFTSVGPNYVKSLVAKGYDVFLDLKFHDIPNTTSKAVLAAADLGIWMVNVHASGGAKMMQACKELLVKHQHKTKLIGVTVLTSMGQQDLADVGITVPLEQHVMRLAKLAENSGLDGVVCSAQEAIMLRNATSLNFDLVTPGIRPVGADAGDQSRIVTPMQAIINGSSYLVIGRPITQSSNPLAVLAEINQEISTVL